jgi:hypothetical protein
MPSLPKQLVIFTLRERRYAAHPRCRGGAYLVKDKLTTEFIPAVAAAHSKQADSGNTRGIVAISLTDPVFLALPAILAA